jgi:hypothetical protein
MTALNGLSADIQTISTGTTGTDFNVVSSGTDHQFNLPTASATTRGALSTTDWSAFNGKQAALVSGTNIKTVNGNSLLGSGNLTISGGGLQGIHNMVGFYPSGYSLSAAITSVATAFLQPNANLIYLNPLIPNKSITYNTIRFNVTTLLAGVNARILIYSDLNGLPNTKLYESADLSCATTGIKSVSVTGTFNAGTIYWIGFHTSGSPTFTSINQTACIPIAHNTMTTAPVTAWTYTYTYGSAPATLNQSFRGVFNASLLLLQFLP